METKQITPILLMLLLLSGCGQYRVGDKYLTFDEALETANSSYALRSLREQVSSCAPLGMDQEHYNRINRKEEEIRRKQAEYSQERERRRVEEELKFKHEFELEFNRQYERARAQLKSEWNQFIENNRGSLGNKTAMEVKKLVADWKSFVDKLESIRREAQHTAYSHAVDHVDLNNFSTFSMDPSWDSYHKSEKLARILDTKLDEKKELLSLNNFHQVFGKPQRTQYLSNDNIYCLYWACKDGTVQIQVVGSPLDGGTVYIREFNIL